MDKFNRIGHEANLAREASPGECSQDQRDPPAPRLSGGVRRNNVRRDAAARYWRSATPMRRPYG
jgi:hypothetical protein